MGIGCRSGEEFFAGALVEGGGVHFVRADSPPAGQDRVDEDVWDDLFPDQCLNIGRSNEVLFHVCQGIGQIGERAQQISAAAGSYADSDQIWSVPDVLDALHRGGSEVVGADEERIVVEDLSAGRLVVGVIQADQRVAEKGSEATARRFELSWRTGLRMIAVKSVRSCSST